MTDAEIVALLKAFGPVPPNPADVDAAIAQLVSDSVLDAETASRVRAVLISEVCGVEVY